MRGRRHDQTRELPEERSYADARGVTAVLRRELHGVGAAGPAGAVSAADIRLERDSPGTARRGAAARRIAVPARARGAGGSIRRTRRRVDRAGADAADARGRLDRGLLR